MDVKAQASTPLGLTLLSFLCDLHLKQESKSTRLNFLGLTPPSHSCYVDSKGVKAYAPNLWGLTPTKDPSDLSRTGVEARASTPWA